MKTFQLFVACVSITIGAVLGTSVKQAASDGREYLIETELMVIDNTEPQISEFLLKIFQQFPSTTGSKPLMNVNDTTANLPL